MIKKIKYFILTLIIFGGSDSFSQEIFEEDEKQEKIYLLEEYDNIKSELGEKILYIQNQLKNNKEFYKDILLEYKELERELLADIKKTEDELGIKR